MVIRGVIYEATPSHDEDNTLPRSSHSRSGFLHPSHNNNRAQNTLQTYCLERSRPAEHLIARRRALSHALAHTTPNAHPRSLVVVVAVRGGRRARTRRQLMRERFDKDVKHASGVCSAHHVHKRKRELGVHRRRQLGGRGPVIVQPAAHDGQALVLGLLSLADREQLLTWRVAEGLRQLQNDWIEAPALSKVSRTDVVRGGRLVVERLLGRRPAAASAAAAERALAAAAAARVQHLHDEGARA